MDTQHEKKERELREEKSIHTIHESIAYSKASLAIEGRYLSSHAEELIRQNLQGEMNEEEFLEAALQLSEEGSGS